MSDDAERGVSETPLGRGEDDHELTFEHGFGASEALHEDDDRSLAEIAGVSEEDVREDLLESGAKDEEAAEEDTEDERANER